MFVAPALGSCYSRYRFLVPPHGFLVVPMCVCYFVGNVPALSCFLVGERLHILIPAQSQCCIRAPTLIFDVRKHYRFISRMRASSILSFTFLLLVTFDAVLVLCRP